ANKGHKIGAQLSSNNSVHKYERFICAMAHRFSKSMTRIY
ncbi:MAG: hypothetical protein ACI9DQ_001016, partial [Glaciecola sp.]